jgi:hypothetical protein
MGTEVELQKIEPVKAALREFLEWYDQRYTMPIRFEHSVTVYYGITEEVEECADNCVKQTKKILGRPVEEEKIKESCQDSCFIDVTAYVNAIFDDVREKLIEHLNKYGIKHVWWEEGWEDVYRYLVIHVQ